AGGIVDHLRPAAQRVAGDRELDGRVDAEVAAPLRGRLAAGEIDAIALGDEPEGHAARQTRLASRRGEAAVPGALDRGSGEGACWRRHRPRSASGPPAWREGARREDRPPLAGETRGVAVGSGSATRRGRARTAVGTMSSREIAKTRRRPKK